MKKILGQKDIFKAIVAFSSFISLYLWDLFPSQHIVLGMCCASK